MGDVLKKVPVREQEPKVRAANFDEVCLGYNEEEAVEEANRCLNCKNARCITGCPVNIHINEFIAKASRERPSLSESWSGLSLTGLEKITSAPRLRLRRTDTASLLSVPVRPG